MPVLKAEDVLPTLRKGDSARVESTMAAKFRVGDRVRVRNRHPKGHTRAPRYARGRVGTIAMDHGVFIFPDTHAHDQGACPCHVYSVRFEGREIWGEDTAENEAIYLDLWDEYLEPA